MGQTLRTIAQGIFVLAAGKLRVDSIQHASQDGFGQVEKGFVSAKNLQHCGIQGHGRIAN